MTRHESSGITKTINLTGKKPSYMHVEESDDDDRFNYQQNQTEIP